MLQLSRKSSAFESLQIEKLDAHLAAWFEDMIISGLFDQSAVFVMADHGNRFDKIRLVFHSVNYRIILKVLQKSIADQHC